MASQTKKSEDIAAELAKVFLSQKNPSDMESFLKDILTKPELKDIWERWQIVRYLLMGKTQREVKDLLGVSISKVSRGSQAIQFGAGSFRKTLRSVK